MPDVVLTTPGPCGCCGEAPDCDFLIPLVIAEDEASINIGTPFANEADAQAHIDNFVFDCALYASIDPNFTIPVNNASISIGIDVAITVDAGSSTDTYGLIQGQFDAGNVDVSANAVTLFFAYDNTGAIAGAALAPGSIPLGSSGLYYILFVASDPVSVTISPPTSNFTVSNICALYMDGAEEMALPACP